MGFLNNEHHGFRKACSCATQLLKFYHDIASNLNSRGEIDCLFSDFQKNFDTVPHEFLIQKLVYINIDLQERRKLG